MLGGREERGRKERRSQVQGKIIDTEDPIACGGGFSPCFQWESKQDIVHKHIQYIHADTACEQTSYCAVCELHCDLHRLLHFGPCEPTKEAHTDKTEKIEWFIFIWLNRL